MGAAAVRKKCCCIVGCPCSVVGVAITPGGTAGAAVHENCTGGCYLRADGTFSMTASGSGTISGLATGLGPVTVSYSWSITVSGSVSILATGAGSIGFNGSGYRNDAGDTIPSWITVTGSASASVTEYEDVYEGTRVPATGAASTSVNVVVGVTADGVGIDASVSWGRATADGEDEFSYGASGRAQFNVAFPSGGYTTRRQTLAAGGTITGSSSDAGATSEAYGSGDAGSLGWIDIFDSEDDATLSGSGSLTGNTTPFGPLNSETMPLAVQVAGVGPLGAFSGRLAMATVGACTRYGGDALWQGLVTYNGVTRASVLGWQPDTTPDGPGSWAFVVDTFFSLNWTKTSPTFASPGPMPEGYTLSITPGTCLPTDPPQFCRPCVRCLQCPTGPTAVVCLFDYDLGGGTETQAIEGPRTSTNPCQFAGDDEAFYWTLTAETVDGVDRLRLKIYRVSDDVMIFDGFKVCRNDGTPEVTGDYVSIVPEGINGGPAAAGIV